MTATFVPLSDAVMSMSLDAVSDLYNLGAIGAELAQEYCDAWNAGPHFGTAIVGRFHIIVRD